LSAFNSDFSEKDATAGGILKIIPEKNKNWNLFPKGVEREDKMKQRMFFLILSVGSITGSYFLNSGFLFFLGLAAILTAMSPDKKSSNDWRSKYRPG